MKGKYTFCVEIVYYDDYLCAWLTEQQVGSTFTRNLGVTLLQCYLDVIKQRYLGVIV